MTYSINPELAEKGTLFVSPGGGGALTPLSPGAPNQVLVFDPTQPLGVKWDAGGDGNVTGPVSSTTDHLTSFADGTGALLKDSGILSTNVIQGPASSTDNALARYDSTTGKLLKNSVVTMADTTGAITFPSGGGTILTAGAGAAERKGNFTFNGSGTHTKILTTAAITDCVIAFTVVDLNGDSTADAIVATIDTGVGFTPVSANATAASIVNWAIVA